MEGNVSGVPAESVDFTPPSGRGQGKEEGGLHGKKVEGHSGNRLERGFSEGVKHDEQVPKGNAPRGLGLA